MGRFRSRGLTLIETIFAMWIFSIVVLSVSVCISGMNAKANQRKLQALALARSECERVKCFINSGYLSNGNNSNKKYTRIFSITDKHDVSYDSSGSVVFERQDNMEPICYDKELTGHFYKPSDLSGIPASITTGRDPGTVIGPDGNRSTLDPESVSRDFRSSAIENDDLANPKLVKKRLCKGYIVDVVIEKEPGATPAPGNISFYKVRTRVAWLEKDAKGHFAVRTVRFVSAASSSVSVYRP